MVAAIKPHGAGSPTSVVAPALLVLIVVGTLIVIPSTKLSFTGGALMVMSLDGVLHVMQSEHNEGDEQPLGDAEASQVSEGLSTPLPQVEGTDDAAPVALGFPIMPANQSSMPEKNPCSFAAGCAKATEPVIMSNTTTIATIPTAFSLIAICSPLFKLRNPLLGS